MKKKLLFVISQFYKGGAEVSLLNLFHTLSSDEVEIDFLIFDQIILKNAHSLIPDIPEWINVCNAAEREGYLAVVNKVINKIWLKLTNKQRYRRSAERFIKGKKYDYAFSVGEWMSPEFVATKVNAKKKAIWIHTDIDKASYVNEKLLFGYNSYIEKYIFVSKLSMESAVKKYPAIKEKSIVIYNMLDEQRIRQLSKESIKAGLITDNPTLLTVANLREEKNYPRQVEAMHLLKERGIPLRWLNIGSIANPIVLNQVKSLISKYHLQDDFLLLGVDENPYKYMAKVDAVAVLSNFESWSMVISEAKILGIPVIATKTSGALEQIVDGENGVLTDFTTIDIANKLEGFVKNYLGKKRVLEEFDQSINKGALKNFYEMLKES